MDEQTKDKSQQAIRVWWEGVFSHIEGTEISLSAARTASCMSGTEGHNIAGHNSREFGGERTAICQCIKEELNSAGIVP